MAATRAEIPKRSCVKGYHVYTLGNMDDGNWQHETEQAHGDQGAESFRRAKI